MGKKNNVNWLVTGCTIAQALC